MGQRVQHEQPDYEYRPTGLMAEEWGKTGHRTEVLPYLAENHRQERRWMDNDASRDALEYIWSLDDATVLGARLEGSTEHIEVCRRLGNVNPLWVTVRAANVAYDRALIDEVEMDRIAKEA